MNSKMRTTHNYQQLNLKNKTKTKQTTGTESQKLRSHRGLSLGRWREENGGKGTGDKKH